MEQFQGIESRGRQITSFYIPIWSQVGSAPTYIKQSHPDFPDNRAFDIFHYLWLFHQQYFTVDPNTFTY